MFIFVELGDASVLNNVTIEAPVTKVLLAFDELVTIEVFDGEIDNVIDLNNKDTESKRTQKVPCEFLLERNETCER